MIDLSSMDTPATATEREERPEEVEGLGRGATLGRYLVYDVLGRGGMGVVVNAYDPELDRRVAVKLLRAARSGPAAAEGQARLLREAQAMARLSHPNVIAVHDVGTWRDRVFVAMELVEGGTLKQWLREKRRPWREVVERFLAAGRGLAAAHAAGIVHRDFKPSNVLVGKDGRVRVTDFGLARSVGGPDDLLATGAPGSDDSHSTPGSASALSAPLTQLGEVLGTPGYMSPEQVRGEEADARSDQFSFCVALWEGLYGARPFGGRTAAELAEQVLAGKLPEPPREASVPGHLRRLLVRGLAVKPADRFPSLEPLLAELARDPAVGRRRAIVAGLAILALASAGVGLRQASQRQGQLCRGAERRLAGVWDDARRRDAERAFLASGRSLAADTFARASRLLDSWAGAWASMRTDACEATRLRGDQSAEVMDLRMACLDTRLEELRGVAGAFTAADAAMVDDAVKFASALTPVSGCGDVRALTAPVRPPADPVTREKVAAVRAQLARARGLADVARYPDAIALARPALEAARALGFRPLEAEAGLSLAEALHQNGEVPASEKAVTEALWAAEAGRHERLAAEAATKLVFSLQAQARNDAAEGFLPLARALVERMGDDPVLQADLADVTAVLAERRGRLDESLREKQRSLALSLRASGPDSLAAGRAHNNLGTVLAGMGRLDEALAEYRQAVAIWEKVQGPTHPMVGFALGNVAAALSNGGRTEEAQATAERGLAILEAALGPGHPETATARLNLAAIFSGTGDCARAVPLLEQARADLVRARGADHPGVGDALMSLASCDRTAGRLDVAAERYRRVQEIYEKKLGPDHPWLVSPLGGLGQIELARGHARQALPLLARAVKLGEANPESPTELCELQLSLADALWKTGDRARARSMAETSRAGWAKLGPEVADRERQAEEWLRSHR